MVLSLHDKISKKSDIIKHVDYDKKKKIFYTNIYLPEYNYVLKTPLASCEDEVSCSELKIEKFDLLKYSYLFYY